METVGKKRTTEIKIFCSWFNPGYPRKNTHHDL